MERYVRGMSLWRRLAEHRQKVGSREPVTDPDWVGRDVEAWRRWWKAHGERELRCILMTAWDPVGAGGAPEAWDEYDSYLFDVAHCLRDAQNPDIASGHVAACLDRIERDRMEAWTRKRGEANADLAESIVAWYEWSFLRGSRPPHEWIND